LRKRLESGRGYLGESSKKTNFLLSLPLRDRQIFDAKGRRKGNAQTSCHLGEEGESTSSTLKGEGGEK